MLLLLSCDVRRFAPVVTHMGWMYVLLGAARRAVDLHAGLPAWRVWWDGPPVLAAGVLTLLLLLASRRGD